MIRDEMDYRATIGRIRETETHLTSEEERLIKAGHSKGNVKRLLDDVRTLLAGLNDERELYERLRRGDYRDLAHLRGIGQALVALRIGRGLTQQELAEKLGVDESLVAGDERNEYHGITVERATAILGVMGFRPELRLKQELNEGDRRRPASDREGSLPPVRL